MTLQRTIQPTSYLAWAFVAFVLFWALGSAPLTDLDEGAFSEASREMIARGDWISPWLLDAPRFDKPVLFHWFQIASLQVFGLNAWGARLPSAMAGLAWVAGIVYWAHLLVKPTPGQDSPVPMLTSLTPMAIAVAIGSLPIPAMSRAATADALLNACLLWTLIFTWRAISDALNERQARHFGRLAALFAGLGLLTKGPIAVLVPAGGLLVFTVLRLATQKHRDGVRGPSTLRVVITDPLAWVLMLAIPAPWYVLQYLAQGMPFVEGFLGIHNLGRFANAMHGFSAGPLYHPAWTAIALLPFLPLLAFSISTDFRVRNLSSEKYGFLWSVWLFVMLFFSIAATKLPHYTFYGLTALMVLLVVRLARTAPTSRFWIFQNAWLVCCLIALMAIGPILESRLELVQEPYYRDVLTDAANLLKSPPWWVWLTGLGGLCSLCIGFIVRRADKGLTLLVGSFAFAAILFGHHVPGVMGLLRGPIPIMVNLANEAGAPLVSWRMSSPSISFWANRVVPDRLPGDDEWVLLQQHRIPELLIQLQEQGFDPVLRQHGLVLLRPAQGPERN